MFWVRDQPAPGYFFLSGGITLSENSQPPEAGWGHVLSMICQPFSPDVL